MRLSRVLAVTRKTFLTLRHDPRSVALMLLAPVMAMFIFGFAFGTEPSHVPVVVVNLDEGGIAGDIVAELDRVALDVTDSPDAEAARALVRDGEMVAVLVFPANFTADATPRGGPPEGARAEVFLDSTNNQMAGVVVREIAEATQAYAETRNASAPLAFDTTHAFPAAAEARFIDYFVPGVMAFAATLFTTLLTLLAFVGERSTGTLDRLRVTPVTEAEIVLGYELAFGAIAAVQGILLFSVAIFAYDILIVGPVALAGLIIVLTAIDAQAIGILISAAAQREGQAVQFIPFIVLPVFILSGIFVPVASLPAWLQPLSYALPPTWAVEGMRNVLLRGWGVDRVWPHVAVLVGFAVVFTTLAIMGLRRARA